MKKTLLLLFGVLTILPTFSRDFNYEYEGYTLTYTVIDEDAKTCRVYYIYDDINAPDTLIIPEFAIGDDGGIYAVTSIYNQACHSDRFTSVKIPNSVTSIGWCAFAGSRLTSVEIPNSVTSIEYAAFAWCSELTSIVIPNSVTSIGYSAFEGCSKLTSIVIPNSVISIDDRTFAECIGLTSVIIPNSVTSIGEGAFGGCSGLTSIVIPNSVTSIGPLAFICSGLTSVEIPNSITEIRASSFALCGELTSVIIPNSVTTIEDGAFDESPIQKIYYNTLNPNPIYYSTFGCYENEYDVYENATLYVPKEALEKFKEIKYWCYFKNILPYDFTDVEEISADFNSTIPYDVFRITGEYVGKNTEGLTPGIYILRQGKSVKKITVL